MKGSGKFIRPKHFIITSNYTIDQVFGTGVWDPMLLIALKRRFKEIEFRTVQYDPELFQVMADNIKKTFTY